MFTNESLYILMFVSGILGSFGHCLGMCGPLIASYSVGVKGGSILPHLLYNLGRISTYTLLGGIVGMTGSFFSIASGVQGLQRSLTMIAGVSIILSGLGLAGWLPLKRSLNWNRFLPSCLLERIRCISSTGLTAGSYYPIGVLLGLIPCGLVYTALIATARSGMEAGNHFCGFLEGILMMFLFGLGTIPPILLFGQAVSALSIRMRERFYRLSALTMIVMGMIFVVRAT